jgi:hypothetical protein
MSVTRLFCLRKDGQFIAWDGLTTTDRPSQAGRFSRTIAERKYPGWERVGFVEAYDQWYAAKRREATE